MSSDELYLEFREFLEGFSRVKCNKTDSLKILLELSDRQWHTYTILCDSLRKEIEDILVSLWDGGDLAVAEDVIAITARLGLVGVFEFFSTQDADNLSLEVAAEIRAAIAEFGDTVGDPYSGMR